MTPPFDARTLALACIVAATLTACSSAEEPSARETAGTEVPAAATSDSTGTPAVPDSGPLQCQDPTEALRKAAATAVARHPGPVIGATLVEAATTDTGTWFVVGLDRAYTRDNGSLSGGASRSFALTDAPSGATFIPLGEGTARKPVTTSWERVSWQGDDLTAGQQALQWAVGCLDEQAAQR